MTYPQMTRRAVLASGGTLAGVAALGSLGGGIRTTRAAQDDAPVAGGSLTSTLNVGDISGFLTWQASTGSDSAAWTAIFDTLVEYDQDYNITGGIFESWTSDDAQTWTFAVRQGVTWHDGVPLVAQDVIDYFETIMAPDSGAGSEKVATIDGATYEAPDDATVVLTLAAPNAALLDDFSSHWLSRTRDLDPAHPIGTGPFTFVEWERNLHIEYAKNPTYWKPGLPYLDALTLRLVPDQDQAINLLTTGEVDAIASVDFPKVQSLSSNASVQLIQVPEQYRLAYHYLLTRTDTAPWDNALVRQALNHAVDREGMLAATLGNGSVRSNPVATGSWAFNPDAPSYNQRDLETAKQLMAEAGYAEGETAFSTTLKYWREWSQMPQIAQIVQANLAEIGIEVELQLLEIGQWVDAVQNDLDYEMALTALVPRWDPSDQLGNAYKTDDGAALLWNNPDFDAAFAAGVATAEQEQRQAAYFDCQQIALSECPGTVLNEAPIFSAAAANVRDLRLHNRSFLVYTECWIAS
ncbi:MAG: ABC transporter substrate-binding protein [Thermomicrobiales bacterium]|nr:ABC transporter substrate-binding protein [Thermomicrobiales bacterium]MCO5223111.1 ABC transporter substrate-binding protein [Thermomicrobiales bacterium]